MKEYFFHFPQIKSYGNNSYHPSFIFTSCFQYNDYFIYCVCVLKWTNLLKSLKIKCILFCGCTVIDVGSYPPISQSCPWSRPFWQFPVGPCRRLGSLSLFLPWHSLPHLVGGGKHKGDLDQTALYKYRKSNFKVPDCWGGGGGCGWGVCVK